MGRARIIADLVGFSTDSGVITFGTDKEITLTHDPDDGLILKHAATADDSFPELTLQTGDTDIAANDKLGQINFQAPDEGTGTDAILVAASIAAVSEGDFSSSSNATKLSFATGASELAAEKMSLSSGGNLVVSGNVSVGGDLDVTGSLDMSDANLTNVGSIQLDSIAGDGDTNSSITFSGSDVITIATGGTTAATFNANQILTLADDLIIKDGGTIGVASDADAITIASNGAVTLTQALAGTSADFDGGVTIDNITIDGTEIDLSSGNLTVDVAGVILLDADGGNVQIHDDGTEIGRFENSSSDFVIKSAISDKDIIFQGNDGGTGFEAARFNMSDRGAFYVGQTNTTILGNGGFAVKPQDANNNVRVDIGSNNEVMLLSTEQSTGAIVSFYKEAGAIGHIGVADSDQIFFQEMMSIKELN